MRTDISFPVTFEFSYSRPILAPMLRVAGKEKTFSNFWYGQDEKVSHRERLTEFVHNVCRV